MGVARPSHRLKCKKVDGSGIERLIKSFNANALLFHWLQVCLVLEFNLLNERVLDRPLLAHIDVGIEPTKITEFMSLFTYGAKFDRENMQGMLQLDLLSSERYGMPPRPVIEMDMELWQFSRTHADANSPVVLVKYVNNCVQAITSPIVISDEAFEEARLAEPFIVGSALTGKKTEKPLCVDSILEYDFFYLRFLTLILTCLRCCYRYINTHIRADLRDQLSLRAPMRPLDKEMIRDAGRNKNTHPSQALRLKMAREGVYVKHGVVVTI